MLGSLFLRPELRGRSCRWKDREEKSDVILPFCLVDDSEHENVDPKVAYTPCDLSESGQARFMPLMQHPKSGDWGHS
jgi:hypothetical protein